jgi:serine protease AprX
MRVIHRAMLLLAFGSAVTTAQTQHYWIVLRNKVSASSLQENSQAFGISERALHRRAKSLPPDRLIDDLDVPISGSILSQLKQTGATIRTVSRWLNAVSVEATPQQLHMLNALSMVIRSEPVAQIRHTRPLLCSNSLPSLVKSSGVQVLDYGQSATQLTRMRVVDLHAIGVKGTGVLVGMLDDGFNNYKTHTALKNISIVADSDFIHHINDVSRQPWENSSQGNHGAGTLSAVGGFDNGHMIGAAYGASFLLAKTEMDSSGNSADFNSEEDTYVAALEWAERRGADVTSSSLGYKEFLSSPTYSTSDMNGRTTKVARAAVIAARKGVLVVTAMGNDGYIVGKGTQLQRADTTLISPADADSIVSVGATSSDGELASFSGTGPTADGRIKPEVVAQGMGIYWADGTTTTGYSIVSGTSCATPLVAGAAALLLSAHPELTNMQVRDALMKTTIQRKDGTSETALYPNNYYGSGFVDAFAAALSLGPVFSNLPSVTVLDTQLIVSTSVISKFGILKDSIFLNYRVNGGALQRVHLLPTSNANEYKASISLSPTVSSIAGYFSLFDSARVSSTYPSKGTTQYLLRQNTLVPQTYTLSQNYPNPFNNKTTFIVESPMESVVEMAIFNLLGQRVKTLFQGLILPGQRTFTWDGINEKGYASATGVYIVRFVTPSKVLSKKMVYLK